MNKLEFTRSRYSARINRGAILFLAAAFTFVTAFACATRLSHADGQPVVASVIAIDGKLLLDRPGKGRYAAYVQMADYMHDKLSTDDKSMAALEFTVGGKIGINQGSSIEIIGTRSAADVTSGHILKLNSGTIWAKFSKQKSPLTIKTPSCTMGIRGTEFLVDSTRESTTIDVFEGTVAYAANKPDDAPDAELPANAQEAKAGTRVIIKNALEAPVVKQYDPKDLRKQDADLHKGLATALVALNVISNIAGFVPGAYGVSTYAGYAAWGVEVINDPGQAAVNYAASYVPYGGAVVSMFGGGGNRRKEPPFIVELKPDQTAQSPTSLTFSWKPFKDAKQYVVLVSQNEKMDQSNLDWAAQVKENTVTYPQDGPPLQPGQKYYWRVVAMGDDGKPRGKASQTWFTVPADYKPPQGQ